MTRRPGQRHPAPDNGRVGHRRRAVIVNAGNHPEPGWSFLALERLGFDVTYLTAANYASDGLVSRLVQLLPEGSRLHRAMRKRQLPEHLERKAVRRLAVVSEIRFLLARREAARGRRLERRNRQFNLRAARYSADIQASVVLAQQTNALGVFRASGPDVVRILNYPIAHHRWMNRYLSEEAAREPGWAASLQGHNLSENTMQELDDEIALADVILVASSFVRQTMIDEGVDADKLLVVPLGSDPTGRPEVSVRFPGEDSIPSHGALRALFAGQVTQRKGLSYICQAINELGPQRVQITFVGGVIGDAKEQIEQLIPATFIPSQGRDALRHIYASHDVLVFPSLIEGFGLVALESMAAGTPVIASRHTLGPDILTQAVDGYIVDPRSAEQIAAALLELHNDRAKLDAMSNAAFQKSLQYTWEMYPARLTAALQRKIPSE